MRVSWPAVAKNGKRLFVAAAYVGCAYVAFLLASPLLERTPVAPEPAEAGVAGEEKVELGPRPESAPARIPEWAWEIYKWHDDPHGHVRPVEAPARLPDWYWEWREWRKGVYEPPGE